MVLIVIDNYNLGKKKFSSRGVFKFNRYTTMNRFEILSERIGVLSKSTTKEEALRALKRSLEQLEMSFSAEISDDPDIVLYSKKEITEAFYWLITISHKHDHCAACLCGDLEEKIRVIDSINGVDGVDIKVMPPRVVNVDNVPKSIDIVSDPRYSVSGPEKSVPDSKYSHGVYPLDTYSYHVICDECGAHFWSCDAFVRKKALCAGCETGLNEILP